MTTGFSSLKSEPLLWKAVLILCAFFFLVPAPDHWQCEGVDEIEYLALSHSIVKGCGYTVYGEPYVYYPPVYPLLTAPFFYFRDHLTWSALYRFHGLLGFIFIAAAGLWLRKYYAKHGMIAAWLLLAGYYIWSFSTRFLMPDVLQSLWGLGAIWTAGNWLQKGRLRSLLLLGLFLFLAALTKFSAIALFAGLGFAGLAAWIFKKNRRGFWLGFVACAAGFLPLMIWQIRAELLAPAGNETYLLWIRKALGMPIEEAAWIAQSAGEGLQGDSTYFSRMLLAIEKGAASMFSIVRPPANLLPAAVTCFLLVLTGWWKEVKQRLESPAAFYTLFHLAMIPATLWATSYLRYFVPILPFLYLFLCSGTDNIFTKISTGQAAFHRVLLAALGLWGLAATLAAGVPALSFAPIQLYQGIWHLCLALVYIVMLYVAARPSILFKTQKNQCLLHRLLYGFLILLFLQSYSLIYLRAERIKDNEALEKQNLSGAVSICEWARTNLNENAACISSLPRMTSFLTDRIFHNSEVELPEQKPTCMFLLGSIRNNPAFKQAEEKKLRQFVARQGKKKLLHSCGMAEIWKIKPE